MGARDLTYQERREFLGHVDQLDEAFDHLSGGIRDIVSLADAQKASLGEPVAISFPVEASESSVTLTNFGLFYGLFDDRVRLVVPVVGNVSPVGISEYIWSEQTRSFNYNVWENGHFDPNSPIARHYERRLHEAGVLNG